MKDGAGGGGGASESSERNIGDARGDPVPRISDNLPRERQAAGIAAAITNEIGSIFRAEFRRGTVTVM